MGSFSIHIHEVSGSTLVVQVTVYLSGKIIPVFLLASYLFWREIAQVLGYTPRIGKKKCVLFPIKIFN